MSFFKIYRLKGVRLMSCSVIDQYMVTKQQYIVCYSLFATDRAISRKHCGNGFKSQLSSKLHFTFSKISIVKYFLCS